MAIVTIDEFEVDLVERKVHHRPLGMVFSLYEYQSEAGWLKSDTTSYSDNPNWEGDRAELAEKVKAAALKAGMMAKRQRPGT